VGLRVDVNKPVGLRNELDSGVEPVVRPRFGIVPWKPVDDPRIEAVAEGGAIPPRQLVVEVAHDLDVLMRHRLPSIPRDSRGRLAFPLSRRSKRLAAAGAHPLIAPTGAIRTRLSGRTLRETLSTIPSFPLATLAQAAHQVRKRLELHARDLLSVATVLLPAKADNVPRGRVAIPGGARQRPPDGSL
jgi:hypothetical protein